MRRSTGSWSVVLILAVAGFAAAAVGAQSVTRVQEIRSDPQAYANEVVALEGHATQWVESTANTTSFYFLKDDWGGVIKVRTSKDKPFVGQRYRVTGPVGIDAFNRNDVFISEETRLHMKDVSPSDENAGAAEGGLDKRIVALIVAIVMVLFVFVGLLIWLVRRSGAPARDVFPEAGVAAGEAEAAAATVVEGQTIKMHAPPPGTLKILPGHLEVVEGDDTVKEIRFYKLQSQSTPELTFGRAAGAPYTHIQLKPMTVSSRQAKMTYLDNQWVLTNFAPATSNPTRHNDSELQVDGDVALKEGDKVAMGEVVLVFHES